MLEKGVSVGPTCDEGGMGGLGCDNGGVQVRCGDGIKEEGVWEGKDAVIIVGTSIMVRVMG